MTSLHEHDAQACAQALPEHDALAYATYGRTDGLTQKHLLKIDLSRNASRTNRREQFDQRQSPARIPQSRKATASTSRRGYSSVEWLEITRPSQRRVPDRRAFRNGAHPKFFNPSNAQGFPARPQPQRENRVTACTNTASRRVQAHQQVDAQRHQSSLRRVVLSPVARWRGKSSGSNPLRPLTKISAANRFVQYDCVCVQLTASLPVIARACEMHTLPVAGFLLPGDGR